MCSLSRDKNSVASIPRSRRLPGTHSGHHLIAQRWIHSFVALILRLPLHLQRISRCEALSHSFSQSGVSGPAAIAGEIHTTQQDFRQSVERRRLHGESSEIQTRERRCSLWNICVPRLMHRSIDVYATFHQCAGELGPVSAQCDRAE